MEIILQHSTPQFLTRINEVRLYTNVTSISAGLTNVYTKNEILDNLGTGNINFKEQFENIYLS